MLLSQLTVSVLVNGHQLAAAVVAAVAVVAVVAVAVVAVAVATATAAATTATQQLWITATSAYQKS